MVTSGSEERARQVISMGCLPVALTDLASFLFCVDISHKELQL